MARDAVSDAWEAPGGLAVVPGLLSARSPFRVATTIEP
jgi:hypothetical protein